LLDQVRDAIRLKHYSIRTEEAYVNWIRRFILFHGKRHPKDMGGPEIEAFLTHLAVEGHVAASTQNQALSALLFLYRDVLHQELNYPIDAVRAKPSQHLPAVLTKDETRCVIAQLSGIHQLQAKLLYGSGLRLLECLRLRVKDLDFERRAIIVRDTKGDEDRVTTWMRAACKKPSARPPAPPASTSASPVIPSATPSPPTCSRIIMTSALSRSSWATRTSRPP
jgi:site-specific recombinase XerD